MIVHKGCHTLNTLFELKTKLSAKWPEEERSTVLMSKSKQLDSFKEALAGAKDIWSGQPNLWAVCTCHTKLSDGPQCPELTRCRGDYVQSYDRGRRG